ncbi:MAG: alpha/beta fold hydrolase [Nocardioidaceae bacterium]
MPVFLHTGGGGDGSMWKRAGYYDSLGPRRFLAVDHRGHGRSTTPEDVEGFRPEELVADVVAVLDGAKVERAVFFGYSAGAAVLCRAAAAHPERNLNRLRHGSWRTSARLPLTPSRCRSSPRNTHRPSGRRSPS